MCLVYKHTQSLTSVRGIKCRREWAMNVISKQYQSMYKVRPDIDDCII